MPEEELSNRIFRMIANQIAPMIIKDTSISANQITTFYFILSIVATVFLALGGYIYMAIGGCLVFVFIVLDNLDGVVARARNQSSLFGAWYDGIVGFIAINLFLIGIAVGIRNVAALLLLPFALLAFPMQHLLAYFYKAEITKGEGSMGDSLKGGFLNLVRYSYGSSLLFLMIFLACILDAPLFVLLFFATIGNLFWMASTVLQYINIRRMKKDDGLSNHS